MKTSERILHTILFEVVALALLAGLAMIFTGKDPVSMTGLAVGLSLIAMFWNYTFNLIFDRIFGGDRNKRGLWLRLGHGAGFELGMILLSFPVIMWVLKLDFMTVLIMDIGAALFFFIYAIVFNWAYDVVRQKFTRQPIAL